MFLQKLIFKYLWPFLRQINIQKNNIGLFSYDGRDIVMLSILNSHMLKNKNQIIIEINKPEKLPYSLATAFLTTGSCSGILINTKINKVLSYSKEKEIFPDLNNCEKLFNDDVFGCYDIYKESSLLYEYYSNYQLTNLLKVKFEKKCSLIILSMEEESIKILRNLLDETLVYSIMILNNNAGLFGIGDMKMRKYLALKGFIFHTRLNGRDDIFILSELVNGFPGNLFQTMSTFTLQRSVTFPNNSDYTKPR